MANHEAPLTIAGFFHALRSGRLETIQKSLKLHGVPASTPTMTDYLFLQQNLKYKHTKVVKALLKAGCRVKTLATDSGVTPLAQAFINENKEIASMLMKRGASIYVNYNSSNNVLHVAAEQRSLKMLKLAIDGKIDVNLPNSDGKTAMAMLLEMYNPEFNNHNQKYLADKIEMIKLLLSRGASADFKVGRGRTALHQIVTLKHEEVIRSALLQCNDVNSRDNAGETPLHMLLKCSFTSEHDVYKIMKLFIEKGAQINIPSSQNITVGHVAAKKKYLKVLNKLYECNCDLSLQDYEGNTVLHRLLEKSVHLNANKLFKLLVESMLCKESLENVQNHDKKTLLHLAAENCHYGILEKILPKVQDKNVTDWMGESVLHKLVKRFSIENCDTIKRLITSGGDVDLKNGSNESPFDLAFERANEWQLLLMIPYCKNLKKYSFQSIKMTEFAQTFIDKTAGVEAVDKIN